MQNYKKVIALCALLLALAGCWYWFACRNDVSDVRQPVEQAEQYNRQTGDSVDSASNEVRCADEKLIRAGTNIDRAIDRVERSKDNAGRNKAELEECKHILDDSKSDISEARRIIESVRITGKETGT